ncbi:MAG: C40 family peptidase [Mycobacterium sp.]|nr:C40 family peptidase [Nocardioidaceae bacterium]MCB0934017.1 C40 family peptidase [Mycobacterium sp.]
MARLGRLVSRIAVALAAPAIVVFAPVQPGESPRAEPQVVAAVRTVHRVLPSGFAAIPGPGSRAGMLAVRAALTRLGDPYVWAAAGPHAFDCSGLVVWSFQQAGVELPHSSQALAGGGQPVALNQIQPGDVVTYYSNASHVGLYVGDGKMVHASTYGVPVAVVPVNNAPIHNVRRYR